MFCPGCGQSNPDNGKFCRSCGASLAAISAPLAEATVETRSGRRRGQPNLESAITTMFMGIAFMVVSVILGVSGMGRGWWFWMLIPAFGMLGSGLARYLQLKKLEASTAGGSHAASQLSASQRASLPPSQPAYVEPAGSRFRTGDLVPGSVTDNTTKHLEIDSEGQTMTLPKK